MPIRETELYPGGFYHVFNKSLHLGSHPFEEKTFRRLQLALWYYRLIKPPMRLSFYLDKSWEARNELKLSWFKLPTRVTLIAYTLMSNHFHLLLRQETNNGIVDFMHLFQDSVARYYNTKNHRQGPLFLGRYKVVRIESDLQLMHVSRYIHLNPVTAYIVRHVKDLATYPWSSWREYMALPTEYPICDPSEVMYYFKTPKSYQEFCEGFVDYERELKAMKKLTLDAL